MSYYTAPMRDITPIGAPVAYTDPKTIDRLLRSTTPETVASSGRSYQDFASAYDKVVNDLLVMGRDLDDAWRGQDAVAAQSQLREVWSTATTVQKTASTFGVVVERHGLESLWWYKYQMPSSTSLGEAQNWMTGANERISQAWSSLPSEISTALPPPPKSSHYSPPGTHPGPTAGGGAAGGGAVSPGPNTLSVAHHATPGTALTGDGADLADFSSGPPPSLSSGLSTTGAGGALTPGAPFTAAPGLGGSGALPGVGGVGGVGGLDSGGVIGGTGGISRGTAQNAALAEEAQVAESGAASRQGLLGPMLGGTGAGGTRQEHEHTREKWLAEDQQTWEGDEVAPPVIGNAPKPEPETPVEVDLSNDDDIADLLNELDEDHPSDPAAELAALRAKLERLERQLGPDNTIKNTEDDDTAGRGWISGEDV